VLEFHDYYCITYILQPSFCMMHTFFYCQHVFVIESSGS